MVTECSMADNVQAELPDVEFVRPCNLCPHMKRITLPKILDSLVYLREEVTDRSADRREGAALGRADDQSEELTSPSRDAPIRAHDANANERRSNCTTTTRRHRRRRHRRRRPRRTVLRAEAGAASGDRDLGGAARRGRLVGLGAGRHRRRGGRRRQRRKRTPPTRSRSAPASSTRASRSALAREAGARIHDLLRYGVPFDRDLEGKLAVGREAAHSARRIVHVRGDMAGKAIMAALIDAVRSTPSIRVIEGYVAEALLTEDGAVTGLQLREAGDAAASR